MELRTLKAIALIVNIISMIATFLRGEYLVSFLIALLVVFVYTMKVGDA